MCFECHVSETIHVWTLCFWNILCFKCNFSERFCVLNVTFLKQFTFWASRFWNIICDWAPQKGVKCPNNVSEKWSLKDEMFQKRDVQQNMKYFRNVTFKCSRNVTFKIHVWDISEMWRLKYEMIKKRDVQTWNVSKMSSFWNIIWTLNILLLCRVTIVEISRIYSAFNIEDRQQVLVSFWLTLLRHFQVLKLNFQSNDQNSPPLPTHTDTHMYTMPLQKSSVGNSWYVQEETHY